MDRIFWADLEMTGLDAESSVIIEFAGIITDLELNPLDAYHSVVYQPPEELEKMDQWNQKTHTSSGLVDLIPKGKPLETVERELVAFLKGHFGKKQATLAGNSIHQDRKFIDRYMKKLSERLHYRMIDVSSFKEIFKSMYQVTVKKKNSHRAIDDILASIQELRSYLKFVQVEKGLTIDQEPLTLPEHVKL